MRVLVLGGSTEASLLARRLGARADIEAVLSLAGRTARPAPSPIPCRIGGFGGVSGLRDYISREKIGVVIDATHPFAARMSKNAFEACEAVGVPLARLSRPPWSETAGDRWMRVASAEAAAAVLGDAPRNVFLTIGRLSLAAFAAARQHAYVIRTIDAPDDLAILPKHRLVLARGPFSVEDELALMRQHGIDVVVSKNSGGEATEAKIAAARTLGLPVVMIERPEPPGVTFVEIEAVIAWLGAHRSSP